MDTKKQWTKGQVMRAFEEIIEDVSMERATETEVARLRLEREEEKT